MSISSRPLPGTTIDPLYPDSDGEPMGETHFHVMVILHLYGVLQLFFRGRTDVYVMADMFLYYKQNKVRSKPKSKAPDVMVAKGVMGNHPRRSFRIWEEGVAPAVVFEITSEDTHHDDEHAKKETYARLGVKEYFLFDPEDMWIRPRLQGFRLHEGKYVALSPDADGRIMSQELELAMEPEEILLRLIDPSTGHRLMTLEEAQDAYAEALDSGQHALDSAQQQLDSAQQQVEQAQSEIEAKRQRIDALEAEIARLRAKERPDQTP